VSNIWHLHIDTGGTFTDCLARDPDGGLHRAKVLSSGALRGRITARLADDQLQIQARWSNDVAIDGFALRGLDAHDPSVVVRECDPETGLIRLDGVAPKALKAGATFEAVSDEPAPVLAARLVTATPRGTPFPPLDVRLATTRGTNALLERMGAPTALFITRGFADLLVIGNQQRPDLFALNITPRDVLHAHVVEVPEHVAADGTVLEAIDLEHVAAEGARLRAQGCQVAAIALKNSFRNPAHEDALAECLADIGFSFVSCSSTLAPLIKLLPRAETAVVDAYLSPVIAGYLDAVAAELGHEHIRVMTSAGGLVHADRYRARDSLLSGPAGGVAGAAAAGRRSGQRRIIGFDMGGTSTDVARVDGDFEYRFDHAVAGVRVFAPALAIESVAAGGGSICEYRDERLCVGPRSAGAHPGPACYGAGGPLTITDVNLLLGRLDPERFEIPIDVAAARAALDPVAGAVGDAADVDELLEGFLDVANARMAAAISQVSVERGYDPAEYTLVAFGGAGGQHACAVAQRLGVRTVLMPADASLLSAVGLSSAVVERFAERQVLAPLDAVAGDLDQWLDDLGGKALAEVAAEGVAAPVVRRRIVSMRLKGQDATIAIEAAGVDLSDAFARRYSAMYGHAPMGRAVEIESIRVVASSPAPTEDSSVGPTRQHKATPDRTTRARFAGTWSEVPEYQRAALEPGACIDGPALVVDRRSAYVIESGWRASVDGVGALIGQRADDVERVAARPAVVEAELLTHRLTSIAQEMGRMLERTALSTNVKERLDFSCTVLDADGKLVVNAPHVPVHLGAMGLCVRALRDVIEMGENDAVATNHPGLGGSHLPDITVVTPVFDDDHQLMAYVASRAHHAELGGTRPGSMPPTAHTLAEEGVVIHPMYLVRNGQSSFQDIERLLKAPPYPSRAVSDNLADLDAQLAANHRGVVELQALARQRGPAALAKQMAMITDRAERLAREAIGALPDGCYTAKEHLDDGAPIQVAITIRGDTAQIDFEGTGPVHPGNLNATPAIVRSTVIYLLRVLVGERLPLNEGLMNAVTVRLPSGMLNPPFDLDDPTRCPAVVGGNVETSQRLVDTLLKALGLCAASQGTMNNTLFGSDAFVYYETVCGGSGAGPDFDGASAVHTHMTNTRITDVEVLEHRYPVRVERFGVRRGTGGRGRYCGGDGAIRQLQFLAPMSLSVVSQHRLEGPFGMDGGEPGVVGRQVVLRAGGQTVQLGAVDGCEVGPGDRFVLETPGGGGFGRIR
jgi:5-oxoprolinase (ATP-hydrolysing)